MFRKLKTAAAAGNITAIEAALNDGARVNHYNKAYAISSSIMRGHWDCVDYLLKRGASVTLPDPESITGNMLTRLAVYSPKDTNDASEQVRIARILIERGVDIHGRDQLGNSAVHWAAAMGSSELVKELVARGVDVNDLTVDGWTPLMAAAYYGHKETVQLLLSLGADPRIKGGKYGNSALQEAARGNRKDVVAFLKGITSATSNAHGRSSTN